MTYYHFCFFLQKGWRAPLSSTLLVSVSYLYTVLQTSMVTLGQLVASSAIWLQSIFICQNTIKIPHNFYFHDNEKTKHKIHSLSLNSFLKWQVGKYIMCCTASTQLPINISSSCYSSLTLLQSAEHFLQSVLFIL